MLQHHSLREILRWRRAATAHRHLSSRGASPVPPPSAGFALLSLVVFGRPVAQPCLRCFFSAALTSAVKATKWALSGQSAGSQCLSAIVETRKP
jgi:hypothetical protein